jgi:hypothetical protein
MILYEGGEDIPTKTNSSTAYCNGSTYKTNNCGVITIIAQEAKYYFGYSRGNKHKSYKYFIVEFEDGTKVQAENSNIRRGDVRNPNKVFVWDVGFSGQGKWKIKMGGKITKEYNLWLSMLRRCYSEEYHLMHPTYKDCTVAERWHNFQNFCEDIQHLEGHSLWKASNTKVNEYDLDKDIKADGNKAYSKEKCKFVSHKENCARYNKKQTVTGLTYVGTRLWDNYQEEFTNQSEFAEKHNLDRHKVNMCCNEKLKETGGWKIEIKRKNT